MRKENIFKFGGQVSGESFIGRHEALNDVKKLLQSHAGSKGIAVIGMNRIGKTSLIHKIIEEEYRSTENLVLLREDINTKSGANLFWHRLAMDLQDKLREMNIEDECIEKCFCSLFNADVENSLWFSSYLDRNLIKIFYRLNALGYRVILILDEFDRAMKLFKEEPGSLGVIRNLASSAELTVTVITISRRKLFVIEQSADPSASTLDGVFDKYNLRSFDQDDMQEYWGALTDYEIFADDAMKQQLFQLAGTHPYLLSLFACRMAEKSMAGEIVDAEQIAMIYHTEFDQNIRTYYRTLVERMSADGYAEKLRGILCGFTQGITAADVNSLQVDGYLNVGEEGYYVISPEFTQYFLEQTNDLYLPAWESIMCVECKLKEMVKAVYPKLDELRYSKVKKMPEWPSKLKKIYPELGLDKFKIEDNMKSGIKYGHDPSIVDVLALPYIIKSVIYPNWGKFQYFFGDAPKKDWMTALDLIVRARTPLAHAHPEYLTERENRLLILYCQQIIELKIDSGL